MKVVIFEYVSSGICKSESLYPDLMAEADIMVNALGQGLVDAGCSVVLFRDPSWPPPRFDAEIVALSETNPWQAILEKQLRHADAYIPLAPESDALLEYLCRKAAHTNCILLNTPAETVHKTADKLYTLKQLELHGIPCVTCSDINECIFPLSEDTVIKPNDSVACEHTFLIRSGSTPTLEQRRYARICQPYVSGMHASLSIIYSACSKPCVLGVNRQEIMIDEHGIFRLDACHVNALAHLKMDFDGLAASVYECFTNLRGYVGIDFIIHDGIPRVLEINPRVTTSFAGLAESTGINPCVVLLAALRGDPLPHPNRDQFTGCTIDFSKQ